jgi:putative membrane protein
LHVYFAVLEAVLWTTPYGRRVFGQTEEQAAATKVLAMNQGLYNCFLAAGLAWSLFAEPAFGIAIARFFLGCVVVAGIVGGVTASRKILFVQGLPALVGLACTWLA